MLIPQLKCFLVFIAGLFMSLSSAAQDSSWVFKKPNPYRFDGMDFRPMTSAARVPHCFFQEEQIYSRKFNLYPGKSTLYYDPLNPQKPKEYIIASKDGKFGVILADTTVVIPPIYISLEEVYNGYGVTFIAKKGDKWGLINYKNEILIPFEFDHIQKNLHYSYDSCTHLRGVLEVRKNGLMGIYMSTGREIVPSKYTNIDYASNDLACPLTALHYKVSLNGKQGYVANTGEEFIPPIYDDVELAVGYVKGKKQIQYKVTSQGKVGILNQYGGEMIASEYEQLDPIQTNLGMYYVFKKNGKYGCLNDNGKVLLSPQFSKRTIREGFSGEIAVRFSESTDGDHFPAKMSYVQLLENGNFLYRLHGKWGLYSVEGDSLFPAKYYRIHTGWGGHLFPESNGKYGLMLSDGTLAAEPIYDRKLDNYELSNLQMSVCKKNGRYGIVNTEGKELIPPKYKTEFALPVGYARTEKCFTTFRDGQHFVVISNAGEEVLYSQNVEAVRCEKCSNYTIVTMDGKEFLMSPDFLMLSPKGYDKIMISNTYSANDYQRSFYVVDNGLKGLIDSTGKERIPCKYEIIEQKSDGNFVMLDSTHLYTYSLKYGPGNISFKGRHLIYYDGLSAITYDDGAYYLMDTNNQYVSKPYDEIQAIAPGYFRCKTAGIGYNCIDRQGKEQFILPYEKVKYFDGKVGVVKLNGLYGIIDSTEEFTLHPTFEKVKGVYDGKICVRKNRKFGVIDFDGNLLLDFVFEVPIDLETIAKKGWVSQWSGNYKYDIDQNFTIRNPWRRNRDKALFAWDYPYHPIRELNYNSAVHYLVEAKGKYGLADSLGNLLIPVEQEEVLNELSFYHNGKGEEGLSDLVLVRQDTLCAIFNMKSKELSAFDYSGWRSIFPGELQVLKDKRWIRLNAEGKEEEVLDY